MASVLYDSFFEHRLDRASPILAFGGGVVGDLAGFAAATFMRGLPYVQVPTTLLADVDSSVGGKVAVNHPAGKNMIGAFYQPKAVFIDMEYLKTLEVGELNAGMAEVVKYGMIRDERFFEFLEENWKDILDLEPGPLLHVIKRSVEIKAEVVSEDEKEQGLRAILNFGHTVGHAVEAAMGYARLRHGEAVSIGMVAAAVIAVHRDMFPKEDVSRLKELLTFLSLPTFSTDVTADAIQDFMQRDKKAIAGRLRFVLPERVGSVRIVDDVTMDEVLRALSECENV
jgi:3-dehydroquinate synthase